MQLQLLWSAGPQSRRLSPASPSLSLITTSISLTTFHAITLGSAGSRVISPHSPTTFQKAEFPERGVCVCVIPIFLLSTYTYMYLAKKAFLSLCEVGRRLRIGGRWRMHQSKITQSWDKNHHSRKPLPAHSGAPYYTRPLIPHLR